MAPEESYKVTFYPNYFGSGDTIEKKITDVYVRAMSVEDAVYKVFQNEKDLSKPENSEIVIMKVELLNGYILT